VKGGRLALVLALTNGCFGPAAARDETVDGLIRIIGVQSGISLYCRKLYTVDNKLSNVLSQRARHALDQALGREQAQAAVDEERKRVAEEISEIGAEEWCDDQRDILNADGVPVFID
jgi:hypothetical protein